MSTSPNGTSPQAPVGVKERRLGGRLRRPGFCGDRRPEGRSLGQCACPSLLTLWIGCLQVMLDKGQDADWFSSTFIRVLATGAALGFIVFSCSSKRVCGLTSTCSGCWLVLACALLLPLVFLFKKGSQPLPKGAAMAH